MYMADKFSNPNLLINPDFKINQRNETEYNSSDATGLSTIYTVDRWCIYAHKLQINSDKTVTLSATKAIKGGLIQKLENIIYGDATVQVNVVSVSGVVTAYSVGTDGKEVTLGILKQGTNVFHVSNGIQRISFMCSQSASITFAWAKLEHGSIATPFVAPNPAEELAKCQRYFIVLPYILTAIEISNALYIKHAELMKMRTDGTVIIVGENKTTYIRFEGQKLKRSFNTSGNAVFSKKGDLKLLLNPIDNFYESKVVCIDINDVKIQIDAEIY